MIRVREGIAGRHVLVPGWWCLYYVSPLKEQRFHLYGVHFRTCPCSWVRVQVVAYHVSACKSRGGEGLDWQTLRQLFCMVYILGHSCVVDVLKCAPLFCSPIRCTTGRIFSVSNQNTVCNTLIPSESHLIWSCTNSDLLCTRSHPIPKAIPRNVTQ